MPTKEEKPLWDDSQIARGLRSTAVFWNFSLHWSCQYEQIRQTPPRVLVDHMRQLYLRLLDWTFRSHDVRLPTSRCLEKQWCFCSDFFDVMWTEGSYRDFRLFVELKSVCNCQISKNLIWYCQFGISGRFVKCCIVERMVRVLIWYKFGEICEVA